VSCEGDHCITCSDEAVELRVIDLRDGLALCEDGTEAMIDLLADVRRGDRILVHAGVALQRAERPEDVPR
jgi:hydrogenase expression/formation protein HypC